MDSKPNLAMKLLKIVNIIDTYYFTLEDDNKHLYRKNIEFYDTSISTGDYIVFPGKVLKAENLLAYGPIIEDNDPIDLITLIHDGIEVHLQRYYG